MRGVFRSMTVVSLLAVLGGCEILQQVAEQNATSQTPPQMPSVAYQDAILVESPSKTMMAAYYCPQLVPDPTGLLCMGFFGVPPSPAQMRVSFDLRFKVQNPNHFPIPVAELLAATVVFPDKTNQSLGAACIAFCGADQPGCTGQPGPGACTAKTNDIKSADDFANAAAGFLVASGVTYLTGGKPSFAMPQVVQDGEITVTARFSFGPEALLGVLKQLAQQAVDQYAAGKTVEFIIPYRIEGGVWFDVGSLGRVALGYGPVDGTWTIPADQIIPKQ
ncbi:MAG: hypothetical protein HY902_19155 [Deltaproteobacteria bacterium]|nr:hypothetical protein [Deltaproteobacteria bacterium]